MKPTRTAPPLPRNEFLLVPHAAALEELIRTPDPFQVLVLVSVHSTGQYGSYAGPPEFGPNVEHGQAVVDSHPAHDLTSVIGDVGK